MFTRRSFALSCALTISTLSFGLEIEEHSIPIVGEKNCSKPGTRLVSCSLPKPLRIKTDTLLDDVPVMTKVSIKKSGNCQSRYAVRVNVNAGSNTKVVNVFTDTFVDIPHLDQLSVDELSVTDNSGYTTRGYFYDSCRISLTVYPNYPNVDLFIYGTKKEINSRQALMIEGKLRAYTITTDKSSVACMISDNEDSKVEDVQEVVKRAKDSYFILFGEEYRASACNANPLPSLDSFGCTPLSTSRLCEAVSLYESSKSWFDNRAEVATILSDSLDDLSSKQETSLDELVKEIDGAQQ